MVTCLLLGVGSVPATRRAGHPGDKERQRGCYADGHSAQPGRTGPPHPRLRHCCQVGLTAALDCATAIATYLISMTLC